MRNRVLASVLSLFVSFFVTGSLFAATLQSVIPAQAPRGARVILTGSGLDDPQLAVTFSAAGGGRAASSIILQTATQLELRVPQNAVSGPIAAGGATVLFNVAADSAFTRVATLASDMKQPIGGIAVAGGTIYVTDTLHHQVRVIGSDGVSRVLAGTGNPGLGDGIAATASFREPSGIAVDFQRSIVYVADTGNHAIRRITADGIVSTLAGSGRPEDVDGVGALAGLKQPGGLVIDPDGNLIVADAGNSKIKRITVNGVVSTIAGGGREGRADGTASDALFNHPQGVAITADGSLLVVDTNNSVIRRIANGAVTTIAGTGHPGMVNGPSLSAEFNHPTGISVDETGNVLIADTQNEVVREISSDTVVTIAGTGKPGSTDGVPTSAQFSHPTGVAFAGALFIADTLNNAIRVVYAAPRLTVVDPRLGPSAGGNQVRLFGAGFIPGRTRVWIGDSEITSVSYICSTELIVTVPGANAGTVDVRITTEGGTVLLSGGYTYVPPPSIFSITPQKGTTAGGDFITLLGTNFLSDSTDLKIGGVAAGVSIGSPAMLTATTPPGAPGPADVQVTTPGGSDLAHNLFIYFAQPLITSFSPDSGSAGTAITVSGSNFDPDAAGNRIAFGTTETTATSATATTLVAIVPAGAQTGSIRVTTAGGTATSTSPFTVNTYTALTVAPNTLQLTVGETQQLTATATRTNGTQLNVAQSATWTSSNQSIVIITNGLVEALAAGASAITATFSGFTATASVTVTAGEPLPPDPATVAPPMNLSTATSFSDSNRFLYTGTNPIQREVAPNAIDEKRVAVLRGRVLDRDLRTVSGVRITILGASQLGYTLSRADGWFDLAANGGGAVVLQYAKDGYITVQRRIEADWHHFATLPDVVLTAYDSRVTAIDLGATSIQIAESTPVHDNDGDRHATMLFAPGTEAQMLLPNGTSQSIATLHVRATEYTTGPNGPKAMPAVLPPQSAYTYCTELSVDEAVAAGASTVTFSKPVVVYVENFLGFPVGTGVPLGYYDRTRGVWVAMPNGRIIRVLSKPEGVASIDSDGDGAADDAAVLAAVGITDEERLALGTRYGAGQSLWRLTVSHFTPFDANWAVTVGAPLTARKPGVKSPRVDVNPDDSCRCAGSVIDCQSQALGEALPIAGTPFVLNYNSARQSGRSASRIAELTFSGSTLPPDLQAIEVTIDVAGRRFTRSYPPAPDLKETFEWDGKDVYGRVLQGAQDLAVDVAYVYPTVYRAIPLGGNWFNVARPDGDAVRPGRTPGTLAEEHHATLRPWDARPAGLGGWTLDVHHTLDVAGNQLLLGDGSKRTAATTAGTIKTVVGRALTSTCGNEGGLATDYCLGGPRALAMGPDGSYYIADSTGLKLVDAAGRIRSITSSSLAATRLARANDGSVYITRRFANEIDRVDSNGHVTRVAGGFGHFGFSGDGGPAGDAAIDTPLDISVAPDESIYFLDLRNGRIRRIMTDGTILTAFGPPQNAPEGFTVAPDGSLYMVYQTELRHMTPDGNVKTITTLDDCVGSSFVCPRTYGEDTRQVAVGPDGSVYVTHFLDGQLIIWRVAADGSKTKIAGGYFQSTSNGTPTDAFFAGDGTAATAATNMYFLPGGFPGGIGVGPDGAVYFADSGNRRLRRIEPVIARPSGAQLLYASSDGSRVSVFDQNGRHLRTVDALLNVPLHSFGYDAAGRLTSVTDASGNVTGIEHDADGNPTGIVAPGGQRTALATGAAGYLSTISNAAGETVRTDFSSTGLLTGLVDERGKNHSFNYDGTGRLLFDVGPASSSKTLSINRTSNDDFTLTRTSTLGRVTHYVTEKLPTGETRRTRISAAGLASVSTIGVDGSLTSVRTDGTTTTVAVTNDPRFGLQSPLTKSVTLKTPSNRTIVANLTRTVTLADAADPLSASRLTDVVQIGGKNWTNVFDRTQRTVTARSPLGRQTTVSLDGAGRPLQLSIPGMTPVTTSYDSRGHVTSTSQGARSATMTWDDSNRLQSVTDTLHGSTQFDYDAADRVVAQRFSGGRTVKYEWDEHQNLLSLTPSGRPAHSFTYSDADMPESYVAPTVVGGGTTRFVWNADHQLTAMTKPDGTIITTTYDAGGRVSSIAGATNAVTYGYLPTGQLAAASPSGGAAVSYGWDGSLLTSMTWSGAVSASVGFAYDFNLRLSGESVNGDSITFAYDDDGMMTRAGTLNVVHDPSNGTITGTTLASTADTRTYTPTGEPQSYTATASGSSAFTEQFTRDAAGRIATRTEAMYGATALFAYTYDDAGRLASVTRNGEVIATYAYDQNGNRLSKAVPQQPLESGNYDDQDRLLSYAGATYTYTPVGDLASKTDASGTATYSYDAFGNLRKVTKPDGTLIEYVIDGQNRRVGKKINGTLIRQWVYANRLQIIAELDGSGAVINRFVYATRTNIPDYLIRQGVTYRIIADHLGSPRIIVNAATGAIAQMLGFDEFGGVLSDSSPGFQSLGYAGGLYDGDTGLVRFGARDYDPKVGRWTTKDPLLFGGGDANLYAYVGGDPINHVDPSGRGWIDDAMTIVANIAAGFGDAISKVLTFGTFSTKDLRNWENDALGVDNVEECSTSYAFGKYAGYAEATATMWAAGLNGGANSTFWSGFSQGARYSAEAVGGTTLEQTLIGGAMDTVEAGLREYGVGLPKTLWNAASATFAANASEATAVIRTVGEGWAIEQRVLEFFGTAIKYLP